MPADIGQMFYYGEIPWHGEGHRAEHPLNIEDALKYGGLDWEVPGQQKQPGARSVRGKSGYKEKGLWPGNGVCERQQSLKNGELCARGLFHSFLAL